MNLGYSFNWSKEVKDDKQTIFNFYGIHPNTESLKSDALTHFVEKIIDAYEKKDALMIFNLTTELQYLHIFDNANGRVSQIIRDSFCLLMGKLPYAALTNMSHYIHAFQDADSHYLDYLRQDTELLLTAVEKKILTPERYSRVDQDSLPRLAQAVKQGGALAQDVKNLATYRK